MPDRERIASNPEQDLIFFMGHEGVGTKYVIWVTDIDGEGNVRYAWQYDKETLEDCQDDNWQGYGDEDEYEWADPEEWSVMVFSYLEVRQLFAKEHIWEV